MGLLDAEQDARLSLREVAVFDDAVNLQRKMSFELLAFRMSETDIGEYIAAALFESHSVFFFTAMVNCSFECSQNLIQLSKQRSTRHNSRPFTFALYRLAPSDLLVSFCAELI